MIEVKNIVMKYQDTVVLNDLSCTIENQKLTAFIGINGVGKSTLLNIIARTLKPNSGEVYIDQLILNSWPKNTLAKKIAILSQMNHINIRLTVEELALFGRYPHTKGKYQKTDYQMVEEALKYLDIYDIRHKFIDELSGGQLQMAYIAMALTQDSEYILLDEPLNNLDMKHAVTIMKILKQLVKEKQKTIIVVIHDINFVAAYADNVVAFKDGTVYKQGANEEVITKQVLDEIYGLNMDIKNVNNCKICLYYK